MDSAVAGPWEATSGTLYLSTSRNVKDGWGNTNEPTERRPNRVTWICLGSSMVGSGSWTLWREKSRAAEGPSLVLVVTIRDISLVSTGDTEWDALVWTDFGSERVASSTRLRNADRLLGLHLRTSPQWPFKIAFRTTFQRWSFTDWTSWVSSGERPSMKPVSSTGGPQVKMAQRSANGNWQWGWAWGEEAAAVPDESVGAHHSTKRSVLL